MCERGIRDQSLEYRVEIRHWIRLFSAGSRIPYRLKINCGLANEARQSDSRQPASRTAATFRRPNACCRRPAGMGRADNGTGRVRRNERRVTAADVTLSRRAETAVSMVAPAGVGRAVVHDFESLYAVHYTSLTTQLYAYFGDRQQAQDVAQEAFCRALARWRQISAYDDPVAWVRRVAWNLATSQVRRSRVAAAFRRRHQPEHIAPPSADRVALFTALRALPAKQRQATVLFYLADLPIAEIADCDGGLRRHRQVVAAPGADGARAGTRGTAGFEPRLGQGVAPCLRSSRTTGSRASSTSSASRRGRRSCRRAPRQRTRPYAGVARPA